MRKWSIDELPQLWNVLVGEMSAVGPRPIVPNEIVKYGEHFEIFCSVLPGMTGLWQVCGRNDTTLRGADQARRLLHPPLVAVAGSVPVGPHREDGAVHQRGVLNATGGRRREWRPLIDLQYGRTA